MATDRTTATLVDALRRGQREAQEQFLRQYAPILFANIVRLVDNAADAEELTQDALMQALRHIDNFDPARSRLQTWLTRIANNLAVSHLRKKKPENCLPLDERRPLPDDTLPPFEAESPSLLEQAMSTLQPDDQSLMWLFYADDLPLAEIAYITGRSPSNVATRLHRLRHRLRDTIINLKNRQ